MSGEHYQSTLYYKSTCYPLCLWIGMVDNAVLIVDF